MSVAVLAHASMAYAQGAARCLTPEAGAALRTVAESGALAGALGPRLRLAKLNIAGATVEIVVSDAAQREHGISLALPEADRGTPDGQGRQLWYYLAAPRGDRSPDATRALLAAAALVDQALPPSAIVLCGGDPRPAPALETAPIESGSSRAHALVSAALQIAIVITAVWVGLSVTRSRDASPPR